MPPRAGPPWIRSSIGGIVDSRSDAIAGHRLVIEARDDLHVGVKAALIVPAEGVAVGSEPLVQLGSYEKQQFPCRRPLLGGQVERRRSVNFGTMPPQPGTTSGGSRGSLVEVWEVRNCMAGLPGGLLCWRRGDLR